MVDQNKELVQTWAWRLCLGTTLLVALLSWLNGLRVQDLVLRTGISFGAMYLLTAGLISLFDKTSSGSHQAGQSPADSGRGSVIDFSVGEGELLRTQEQELGFPGQVDKDINSKLSDSEQQAKMVRRMGWD